MQLFVGRIIKASIWGNINTPPIPLEIFRLKRLNLFPCPMDKDLPQNMNRRVTTHNKRQPGAAGMLRIAVSQMASRGGLAIRNKLRAAFASLTCSQLWLIAACACSAFKPAPRSHFVMPQTLTSITPAQDKCEFHKPPAKKKKNAPARKQKPIRKSYAPFDVKIKGVWLTFWWVNL
jgi:hypothetical protein